MGDSALTSAKDALSIQTTRRKNQDSKRYCAFKDILSLYPTVTQSAAGSGATPIGSAGCAPDRNTKLKIRRIWRSRTRARGLEFEEGNVVLRQQLTGSNHGTGLVTRFLVQMLKEPKVIGMKTMMEPKNVGMKTKMKETIGMKILH